MNARTRDPAVLKNFGIAVGERTTQQVLPFVSPLLSPQQKLIDALAACRPDVSPVNYAPIEQIIQNTNGEWNDDNLLQLAKAAEELFPLLNQKFTDLQKKENDSVFGLANLDEFVARFSDLCAACQEIKDRSAIKGFFVTHPNLEYILSAP
jgi:hypothetical protein